MRQNKVSIEIIERNIQQAKAFWGRVERRDKTSESSVRTLINRGVVNGKSSKSKRATK